MCISDTFIFENFAIKNTDLFLLWEVIIALLRLFLSIYLSHHQKGKIKDLSISFF